jgi:hypothetical protein
LSLKTVFLRLFTNIYIDEESREPIRLTQVYNVAHGPEANYKQLYNLNDELLFRDQLSLIKVWLVDVSNGDMLKKETSE